MSIVVKKFIFEGCFDACEVRYETAIDTTVPGRSSVELLWSRVAFPGKHDMFSPRCEGIPELQYYQGTRHDLAGRFISASLAWGPSLSRESTAVRCIMWSSLVFEKIMMSSRYSIAHFHRTELSTISIARWTFGITNSKTFHMRFLNRRASARNETDHYVIWMPFFRGLVRQSCSSSIRSCNRGCWRS